MIHSLVRGWLVGFLAISALVITSNGDGKELAWVIAVFCCCGIVYDAVASIRESIEDNSTKDSKNANDAEGPEKHDS